MSFVTIEHFEIYIEQMKREIDILVTRLDVLLKIMQEHMGDFDRIVSRIEKLEDIHEIPYYSQRA